MGWVLGGAAAGTAPCELKPAPLPSAGAGQRQQAQHPQHPQRLHPPAGRLSSPLPPPAPPLGWQTGCAGAAAAAAPAAAVGVRSGEGHAGPGPPSAACCRSRPRHLCCCHPWCLPARQVALVQRRLGPAHKWGAAHAACCLLLQSVAWLRCCCRRHEAALLAGWPAETAPASAPRRWAVERERERQRAPVVSHAAPSAPACAAAAALPAAAAAALPGAAPLVSGRRPLQRSWSPRRREAPLATAAGAAPQPQPAPGATAAHHCQTAVHPPLAACLEAALQGYCALSVLSGAAAAAVAARVLPAAAVPPAAAAPLVAVLLRLPAAAASCHAAQSGFVVPVSAAAPAAAAC